MGGSAIWLDIVVEYDEYDLMGGSAIWLDIVVDV